MAVLACSRLRALRSLRSLRCAASVSRLADCVHRGFATQDEPDEKEGEKKGVPTLVIKQTPFDIFAPFKAARRAFMPWYCQLLVAIIFETDFHVKEFLEGAKDAFALVHQLADTQDFDRLRDLVSPHLLSLIRERNQGWGTPVTYRTDIAPGLSAELDYVHWMTGDAAQGYGVAEVPRREGCPDARPSPSAEAEAGPRTASSDGAFAIGSQKWRHFEEECRKILHNEWLPALKRRHDFERRVGPIYSNAWLFIDVRFQGRLTVQVTDAAGLLNVQIMDLTPFRWRFGRGPLPHRVLFDCPPRELIDCPWIVLDGPLASRI